MPGKRGPARKADFSVRRDLGDHDGDLIADVQHILDAIDANGRVLRELGDMHQAVFTGKDLDKGSVGHDADDFAVVDLASLDAKLLREAQNALNGRFSPRRFCRRDGDSAIIVDVNPGAGFLLDGRGSSFRLGR